MNFSEFLQAGIIGCFGKPGAGKSYFATKVILEEVKGENRPIVTNVPIKAEEVQKQTGKQPYIYQLETFTNNMFFFTQRGDYKIDLPEFEKDEAVNFNSFLKEHDEGVLYIIDEAGLYFNARNWRYMQGSTMSYFTFIRHVGDTCLWLSQNYTDVDKQIRGKTQTFNLMRNLSKERYGWFKRGTKFKVYQYVTEHAIDNSTMKPQQEMSYVFDKKIAACYQTSLFNKKRDEKHKVKGIPLPWIFGGAVVLVLGFMYWISTGGIRSITSGVFPQASSSETTSETLSAQVASNILPVADPFKPAKEVPTVSYEYPFQTFVGYEQPFGEIAEDQKERMDDFFFGIRRYCTLTFISESQNNSKELDFSFSAILDKFTDAENYSIGYSGGTFALASNVFQGAVKYVRDRGTGQKIKTVKVIVKENVPFKLHHGFEIPLQKSIAIQGTLQTSVDYKEIGFDLELILEATDKGELLKVYVKNNEVIDITAPIPVLASFENSNVFQVKEGMTYEIADFNSMETDQYKGILRKRDATRSMHNHVYISYGSEAKK